MPQPRKPRPITFNRPGAPANPPQHLVSEDPAVLGEDHLEKRAARSGQADRRAHRAARP